MSEKIKPLFDYVLIKPIEEETKTSSGIVIPDSAKEKPQRGKVVEVGPGKRVDGELVEMTIKKGDVVVYKNWGGREIKIDGEEHLLIKEEDLLAIVS